MINTYKAMIYLILCVTTSFFFILRRIQKRKWLLMDYALLFMAIGTLSDLFILRSMDINLLEFWETGKPPAEEIDIMDKLERYQENDWKHSR
jgi:hypothetical protein